MTPATIVEIGDPVPAARDLVAQYLEWGFPLVFWPQIGDAKGPIDKGWPDKKSTLDDYREGLRVGVKTGTEIAPGTYLHDSDIDWAQGTPIAEKLLPRSNFCFGRRSKFISHRLVTLPVALPSRRYEDIDKTSLLELRGTKQDGECGLQTMIPPSIWSKNGQCEPLEFRCFGAPTFYPDAVRYLHLHDLTAIGLLLAKHLGHNGFGHNPRLAWAGFLLRAGVAEKDLILMGEGMSIVCNNREVDDVREAVESTVKNLAIKGKKVKGGPALAKLLGPKGRAVIARINEWLGRDQDFIRVEGVIVRDSQENIRRAVERLDVTLSHDEFAERTLIQEDGGTVRHLEDAPLNDLWLRIDREFKFRPSFTFFEKVINQLARENTFHPVRDYLDALEWDGTPRINTWLADYGGAVDDTKGDADDSLSYLEAVSSLPLLAAVKRVYEPGSKYDEMLVLESKQGWNKSRVLRALCPDEAWFSDDLALNVGTKQLIEATLGKWIVEASDLSGKRKAEIEQLKAMMSRQADNARMAYAHIPVERRRHFIVIGTTNAKAYLNDPTGARRFWPVELRRPFDVEGVRRVRDQLWAEAVVRVKQGESIRLPQELWPAATEQQEKRREIDPWEDLLRDALVSIKPSGDGKRRVLTNTLFDVLALDVTRRDRTAALRVSDIMQRLGFKRTNVRVAGNVGPGYVSVTSGDDGLALREEIDDEPRL